MRLTVSDVRVVGLGQQGDDAGALLGDAHEQEAQVEHRGPAHVVGHVADRKVEQPLDRRIVGGAAVGHANGKDAPVPAPEIRSQSADAVSTPCPLSQRSKQQNRWVSCRLHDVEDFLRTVSHAPTDGSTAVSSTRTQDLAMTPMV